MLDQSTSENLEASEAQPTAKTTTARTRDPKRLRDDPDPDDPQICRGVD